MDNFYRLLRLCGLNATRAFIAAKMLHGKIANPDAEFVGLIACGMRSWTDHMCRTFVKNGYQWPQA